jgi:hypothetical protein
LSFSKRSREYTAYSCVPNQYVDLGMHGDVCVSSLGQAAGASTQAKPCSRFQKLLPSYMADRHRVQVKRCRNHPARACIQLEERDSDRSAMRQREREREKRPQETSSIVRLDPRPGQNFTRRRRPDGDAPRVLVDSSLTCRLPVQLNVQS